MVVVVILLASSDPLLAFRLPTGSHTFPHVIHVTDMALSKIRVLGYTFTIVLLGVPIILIFILLTFLVHKSSRVIELLGNRTVTEANLQSAIVTVLDETIMLRFRDDLMEFILSGIEFEDDLDRWGLLRQMETGREDMERNLRDGELAFSISGGVFSILIAATGEVPIAGIVLTLVVLCSTLLVILRVTAVEILSFESHKFRAASYRSLVFASIWNRSIMTGLAPLGIALMSLMAGGSSRGYEAGLWIMEQIAFNSAEPDDSNWYSQEKTSDQTSQ